MTKIVVIILSILLTFFPNSVSLLGAYQDATYPGEKVVTERVIEAVENGDVEAIEEMMSQYVKSNNATLSEDIKRLMSTMEGNIKEAYWYAGAHDSIIKNYDLYESYGTWVIKFETDKSDYKLHVTWIRANTDKPEMVGLSSLSLSDMEYNILAEVYAI